MGKDELLTWSGWVIAVILLGLSLYSFFIYAPLEYKRGYDLGYNDGYAQSKSDLNESQKNVQILNGSLNKCLSDLEICNSRPVQKVNVTVPESGVYSSPFGDLSLTHNEIYYILNIYYLSLFLTFVLSFSLFKFEIKIENKWLMWGIVLVLILIPIFIILIFGKS